MIRSRCIAIVLLLCSFAAVVAPTWCQPADTAAPAGTRATAAPIPTARQNPTAAVSAATVQIETFDKAGSKRGAGSGFVVDPTGIIVTNNHVLDNGASIIVKTASGDVYKDITVRDFDEVKDIAIIKVSGFDMPTVKLGNSTTIKGGEKVFTCGFTLGEFANTLSDGLVSGVRHNEKGFKYFQMSAPISPGNSGGPVFLDSGEVIGISTASQIKGQNVNFAVPINYVLGMLENDKKLTLAQYSGLCGQGMTHMIIDAKKGADEQLAHPDSDIAKRVVIVPFSGFCQFMPTAGTEILAALVLRMKENFKDENLFVVDHQTVVKNLQETMGDQYDSLLKQFDAAKAREFAVKFRANTVIYGKINHFAIDNTPVFVPFVGWVPSNTAVMNIDYAVYKLDTDKVLTNGNIRRKAEMSAPDAIIRIANIIVGEIKEKYKTFASTNRHGDKPIVVRIDANGNPEVVLKDGAVAASGRATVGEPDKPRRPGDAGDRVRERLRGSRGTSAIPARPTTEPGTDPTAGPSNDGNTPLPPVLPPAVQAAPPAKGSGPSLQSD